MQRHGRKGPFGQYSASKGDIIMFHTAGFLEDIDPAGAFVNINALADQRLFTQGDDLRVPVLNQVFALAAGLDAVVAPRARIESPTLDQQVRYEISPINSQDAAAVEPDSPQKVDDLRASPLILGVDEILQCQINSNPAADQDQWVLLWFSDGAPSPVTGGRQFTVRATAGVTLVANAWTDVQLILDENLNPGNYQAVGLRPDSLGCVAGRYIFRTGNQWRPGALGVDSVLDLQNPMFRHGQLGVWGEFPFTQIPSVEVLSVIADTVETFHLDLIRVGG